ncbi:SAM-dependent chlorinase/fluorinase [Candidatus Micrarchaeota archaeon]|nr:SAM-dependent chlorinase/fluorinase [Candidatus Micrarchaeota archaeon]
MKLISLTSDFGVQTQGIAAMRGSIWEVSPDARVVDLMHGIESFNLFSGARTMESVVNLPVGCHVCVVDPGVGTKRRGIAIQVGRGDYLIGPDNGVLMTAPRFLGGIKKVVALENSKYMKTPVSPIFHGRDVFVRAAAHLCEGVELEEFGRELEEKELIPAPYGEAEAKGGTVKAKIIHVNKYGSVHLNMRAEAFKKWGVRKGGKVEAEFTGKKVLFTAGETFGDVPKGEEVIFADDYGRVEMAVNMGSFAEKHGLKQGQEVVLKA